MIGIVGFGFVGQAQYYKINSSMRLDLVVYDKYIEKFENGLQDINSRFTSEDDIIITCLPTNMNEDGSQDFSAYEEFFTNLTPLFKGTIVIKSTILYSNIEPYLKEFNIVYSPEFLNQNTALEDSINESRIVIGGRIDLCTAVSRFYSKYSKKSAIEFKFCSIQEAIHLKYTHNIYHAYKVLFWNYVQEITDNQRKIFDLYSFVRNRDMSNEMSRIYADGKAGYGGACFTKDVNAYNELFKHELTEFMRTYNERIRWDNQQTKD